MSELFFDDLIPAKTPTPGFFEMMMHEALVAIVPGYLTFNGLVSPQTAARREVWPQTPPERGAQAIEPVQGPVRK